MNDTEILDKVIAAKSRAKVSVSVSHPEPAHPCIQSYGLSVFTLVLLASLMSISAISLLDFARIVAACTTLIGMYALLFRVLRHHDISALAIIGVLVALPALTNARYVVYLMGVIGCGVLIQQGRKYEKNILLFLPILFAAIFGSRMYADFQYRYSLISGDLHLDTLFHATVSAMYSHYGVASVALDGLVPITYYTLSHKIMAGLAILSGFETLAVYSYLFFSMGPLLLAFSLAGLACQLNSNLKFSQALIGIALMMLGIVAIPVFSWVAMWDSFLVSESYLLSLVILTISISTLKRWIDGGAGKQYVLGVSLLSMTLACLAKGSVGLVGICVFGLLGITRYRTLRYWIPLVMAISIMYIGISATVSGFKNHIPITPFDFVFTYVRGSIELKLIAFLSIHFLSVWICFALGIFKSGSAYFKGIEFQILLALLLPALFFSLTFKFSGGSGYYFSSIPVIISMPFLVANFASYLDAIKFKHVVVITLIAFLVQLNEISSRSFVRQLPNKEKNMTSMNTIVKQLQDIRDNSATNAQIKIENPERLVSKIGCKAYWFLPAVMERPLVDGLPNKNLCPQYYYEGTYGVLDYYDKKLTRKFNSKVELIL